MTEDEVVGWHHPLSGHEFEQTQEIMKDWEAWHAADPQFWHAVVTKSLIRLNNNIFTHSCQQEGADAVVHTTWESKEVHREAGRVWAKGWDQDFESFMS